MSRTGAKAHRVDSNAPYIIAEMRRACIAVKSTPDVCPGFPDAVWAFRGITGTIEFKVPGGKLRASQEEFIATWPGVVIVAESPEQAILAVYEAARPR